MFVHALVVLAGLIANVSCCLVKQILASTEFASKKKLVWKVTDANVIFGG